MPVKIRLRRMGAKHQPSYRIVVADSRSPRDGRYIDQVGFYNPLTNPATLKVDTEKAVDWLRKGAQPTETVAILLKKFNIEPRAVRTGEAPAAVAVPSVQEQEAAAKAAKTAKEPAKPKRASRAAAEAVTEAPVAEAAPAAEETVEETVVEEVPVEEAAPAAEETAE